MIRNYLRKRASVLLHSKLRNMGFQIVDANSFLRSQDAVEIVETRGGKVQTILDIGAHKGQWSLDLSRYLDTKTHFSLFEPSMQHASDLQKLSRERGWNYFPVALGKENGFEAFYSKGGTGDSFYLELGNHYSASDLTQVEVKTLDDLINQGEVAIPDLMKLDCQGSEKDVLIGARNILTKVSALIVETQLVTTNLNSPNIVDVINFLSDFNFSPYSICEIHNRSGVLNQIDLFFLNNEIIK